MEIKSISREAGSRTKLAVWSADPNVDPIGACVGPLGPAGEHHRGGAQRAEDGHHQVVRGTRRPYCRRPRPPSDVISVEPFPDGKSCRVVVPDDQLSLAIGKEGQNARLAAKLTGYKIDIKPASRPLEPIEGPRGGPVRRGGAHPGSRGPGGGPVEGGRYYGGGVNPSHPSLPIHRRVVQNVPKKIPMRQCVGCREMKPKRADPGGPLPEGQVSLDFKGKLPGRGPPVSRPRLPGQSQKSRALERAFSAQLPDEVWAGLEAQMKEVPQDAQ